MLSLRLSAGQDRVLWKMTETIELQFGIAGQMGPSNGVLYGKLDQPIEKGKFCGEMWRDNVTYRDHCGVDVAYHKLN